MAGGLCREDGSLFIGEGGIMSNITRIEASTRERLQKVDSLC